MPILPEPKIRCPKCLSTILDLDPKWVGEAEKHAFATKSNPWAYIRKKVVDQFREFGPLKGWMTQGECPEKDCDGKWWDGEKLNVAVPHHLKEAKRIEEKAPDEPS